MSQATELIARQMAAGSANARVWADILYNVKLYGAKGDWNGTTGTDDTASVQATIDAATAAGGKAVFFPHGTYKVTALTGLSSVVLFGDNASFVGISNTINQIGSPTSNIAFNIKEYGAKGDGTTDDASAIQAAINAMPVAGGTLYFPDGTYNLEANITFGSKTVNVMVGPNVEFTGTGKMPTTLTNPFHQLVGNYQIMKPDTADLTRGYGYSTISAEIAPASTFFTGGAAVAGYFGAISPLSGDCLIWALNPIVKLQNGFQGNGVGVEVDIDNYMADFKGQGVLVTGIGDYRPEIGLKIMRGGTGVVPCWSTGISLQNFEHGIYLDGTNSPAVMGLEIVGMESQHIHLQTNNDTNPSNAVIYITNADSSKVMFKITKAGYLQIGDGGTEIKKHLHGISPVVNFGSIPANSTSDLTFAFSGVESLDTVVVNNSSLPSGFMVNAWASATGTITVRCANVTTSAGDPDGGGGSQFIVDVWKH